jgi:Tropinone reductase 1
VNNAGTNVRQAVLDATEEEYRSIMGLNLEAVYFLCRDVHPLLVKSSRPTIVNVASVAVRVVAPGCMIGYTERNILAVINWMCFGCHSRVSDWLRGTYWL